MKRIMAIAALTLRETVHSGAAAALLGLTLALVGWLALILQGDGTLAGQVRVFLRYATGTVAAVLGLATLWLASSRIASEVDDRTIQTVAVKPVRAAEIFLGKWLGLVLLDAALLAAAGTAIAGGAFHILKRTGEHTTAERNEARRHSLVCRLPLAPMADRPAMAATTASEEHDDDGMDAVSPREEMMRQTVPPGRSRVWTFDLPRGPGDWVWLQFHFNCGSAERLPMEGAWSLARQGISNTMWSAAVSNLPAGRHRIPVLPSEPVVGKLTLTFSNAPAPESGVIVFRPKAGAILLAGESNMAVHLFRALLIVLLKLSVLAAAGLACSALFSTPVATFAATALAVMTLCVQYFLSLSEPGQTARSCGHDHGLESAVAGAWYERAADSITRVAAVIVQPVASLDGIEPVSDGLVVPWTLVGRSAFVLLGGYCLALAAIGVIALRRRELADV
jgi:hypothetical protein